MKWRGALAAPSLLVLLSVRAAGQSSNEPHFEMLAGTAWNFPTVLVIRLPGEPSIRHSVHYSTHPWSEVPYYAYRLGGGSITSRGVPSGYEVEMLHHKLYLDHPPPPVEQFAMSHGFNLVTANAVRPADRLAVRFGLGLIIAHPEGRISGERVGGSKRTLLGGGYHIAGVTGQVAVGRRYLLTKGRFAPYVVPEVKLTASLAQVPLGDAGGRVVVPNFAAHLLTGFGVRWLRN